MNSPYLKKSILTVTEGTERVKWELGLAGFAWENGVQVTLRLGFGHWQWGKNVKNQKWEWNLRIAK